MLRDFGRSDIVALAVLLALLGLRFLTSWSAPEPLIDEDSYFIAFDLFASGEPPYRNDKFYYPPAFAAGGAFLVEHLGFMPTLVLLRLANALGLAILLWLGLRFLDAPWLLRLLLGSVFALMLLGVSLGVEVGNVSLAVCGMVMAALCLWPGAAMVAGLLMGASALMKPLAPASWPILFVHGMRWGRPRAAATAVLAGVVAVLGFLLTPYLRDYLELSASLPTEDFPLYRTVSLRRVFTNVGVDVGSLPTLVLISLVACAAVWRWRFSDRHLTLVCLAAITLSVPMWPHTLLLSLPAQMVALQLAWRRLPEPPWSWGDAAQRLRYWELIGVVGLAAICHTTDKVGAIFPGPSITVAIGVLVPTFAPSLLTGYVIWRERGAEAVSRAPAGTAAQAARV